jgi:hypothetical protein
MKFLPAILFLLASIPVSAGLTFETPLIEVDAGLDSKTLTRDFKFTNSGEKPVKIIQADAGCSCLGVQVAGGKFTYAPGEAGVIRAVFEIGSFQGTVDKPIHIWLQGDPEDAPSTNVSLRVHIPVIIGLEPKTLKWDLGGSSEAKSIDVEMNYKQPIHIKSVTTSNESFSTKLITVEEGKRYKIEVTPVGTGSASLSIVRIETDVDVEKQRIQQGFAVISAQLPQP